MSAAQYRLSALPNYAQREDTILMSTYANASTNDEQQQCESVGTTSKPHLDSVVRRYSNSLPHDGLIAQNEPGSTRKNRLSGWRFGVLVCACTTGVACILNIAITIWATGTYLKPGGFGTAYEGKCSKVNSDATWVHLLINVISACLLSASNYSMQCLAAPSRSELDSAHARYSWLDVGMNSIYNLRHISMRRAIPWLILAVSTLPIHLLYNSVVFKVLAVNEYAAVVVNEQFLQGQVGSWKFASPTDDQTMNVVAHKNCSLLVPGYQTVQPYSFSDVYNGCHFSDCGLTSSTGSQQTFTSADIVSKCGSGPCQVRLGNGTIIDANAHVGYGASIWRTLGSCNFSDCQAQSTDQKSIDFADTVQECFGVNNVVATWHNRAVRARDRYLNSTARYKRLGSEDCLSYYGNDYVTDLNDVLLITSSVSTGQYPAAYFYYDWADDIATSYHQRAPHNWLCNDQYSGKQSEDDICSVIELKDQIARGTFTLGGQGIDHCLVQEVNEEHCKLQFSPVMLAVVIACMCVKTIVIVSLFRSKREEPIIVVGDAIASYLERPEEKACGRCLFNAADMRQTIGETWNNDEYDDWQPGPCTYHAKSRKTWFEVGSRPHLWGILVITIGSIATGAHFLRLAIRAVQANFGPSQSPWTLGFGAVNSQTLIRIGRFQATSSGNIISAALVANSPQVLASLLFLLCNAFMTSMLLANEWSGYGKARKSLRTSMVVEGQRTTYFLQLPFRYSVPLLIASSVLHWLISEAIFLVRVDAYDQGDLVAAHGLLAVGYSPLPILLALVLVAVMLIAILAVSAQKLDSDIPVASSNSLAIAAACFRPAEDVYAAVSAVKWGEVKSMGTIDIGHCCFTSFEVHDLVNGRQYAGTRTSCEGAAAESPMHRRTKKHV